MHPFAFLKKKRSQASNPKNSAQEEVSRDAAWKHRKKWRDGTVKGAFSKDEGHTDELFIPPKLNMEPKN